MPANITIKTDSFINMKVLKNRVLKMAVKGNKSVFSKFRII
jgi:hypothetical protein